MTRALGPVNYDKMVNLAIAYKCTTVQWSHFTLTWPNGGEIEPNDIETIHDDIESRIIECNLLFSVLI